MNKDEHLNVLLTEIEDMIGNGTWAALLFAFLVDFNKKKHITFCDFYFILLSLEDTCHELWPDNLANAEEYSSSDDTLFSQVKNNVLRRLVDENDSYCEDTDEIFFEHNFSWLSKQDKLQLENFLKKRQS